MYIYRFRLFAARIHRRVKLQTQRHIRGRFDTDRCVCYRQVQLDPLDVYTAVFEEIHVHRGNRRI